MEYIIEQQHCNFLEKLNKQIISCPINKGFIMENGIMSNQVFSVLEIPENKSPFLKFQNGIVNGNMLASVVDDAKILKNRIQKQAEFFLWIKTVYPTSFVSTSMLVDYCENYAKLIDEESRNDYVSFSRFQTIFNRYIVRIVTVITDYLFSEFCQEKESTVLIRILDIVKTHLFNLGVYTPTRKDPMRVDYNYYAVDAAIPTEKIELNECIRELRSPAYLIGNSVLKSGSAFCYIYKG